MFRVPQISFKFPLRIFHFFFKVHFNFFIISFNFWRKFFLKFLSFKFFLKFLSFKFFLKYFKIFLKPRTIFRNSFKFLSKRFTYFAHRCFLTFYMFDLNLPKIFSPQISMIISFQICLIFLSIFDGSTYFSNTML